MVNLEETKQEYLLGHADDELRRLEQQGEYFSRQTAQLLLAAGLRPGMRVLDLGCGAGDVTLQVAEIVGLDGTVLGVDRSVEAVDIANRRIASWGHPAARCIQADVFDAPIAEYDAIVGRFLLMHLPDPASLIERIRGQARADAIIAFLEMDVSSASICPNLPLFEEAVSAIAETYRKARAEPDMGSRLYEVFRRARLTPSIEATCRVEGGPTSRTFSFLARTVKSLEAGMIAHGVMSERLEPESLAERLYAQAAENDTTVVFPRLIGAWATV